MANKRVRHTVGRFFYDDGHKPVKQGNNPKQYIKLKRHLHSRKIRPLERIIFIEIRKNFLFNRIQYIRREGKRRFFVDDINLATGFHISPDSIISNQESLPKTKHFIVSLPSESWSKAGDKLELLMKYYPLEFYPDLYKDIE